MIVAGVMSGTSADGINVALVRIGERGSKLEFKLLGHAEFAYPQAVRHLVLYAMNASRISVADLARLNFLLAELYADAVLNTQKKFRMKAQLIGCHGQTLYHQGEARKFLGRKIAVTWQSGEGAVLAARVGVPVVADFRPADMAAGGKGAPLVPLLDYFLYCDPRVGRIVQNIGGIGNLSSIPAGARTDQVVAFDTGPGNMVIDSVTDHLFGQPFDRSGRIAALGTPIEPVIRQLLRGTFFRQRPPRTAGREEFGKEFIRTVSGVVRPREKRRYRCHCHGPHGTIRLPIPCSDLFCANTRIETSLPRAAALETRRCLRCWPMNSRRSSSNSAAPTNLGCLPRPRRRPPLP